jgi:hypothetical protein
MKLAPLELNVSNVTYLVIAALIGVAIGVFLL